MHKRETRMREREIERKREKRKERVCVREKEGGGPARRSRSGVKRVHELGRIRYVCERL